MEFRSRRWSAAFISSRSVISGAGPCCLKIVIASPSRKFWRPLKPKAGARFVRVNFHPPGCENALCSFHGRFFITVNGGLKPVVTLPIALVGSPPEAADVGARRTVAAVSRQWGEGMSGTTLPAPMQPLPWTLTASWKFARNRSFSISAMAFQDVWTLDMERLRDCCIHVVSEDGRLIPFCAYNLTDSGNQPLYRGR